MSINPQLKALVKGAYDLQALRMQAGLRLCANFRAKIKGHENLPDEDDEEELSEKKKKIIDKVKADYRLLTTGIAKNSELPRREGFNGGEIISTYAELVLVNQYLAIEREESRQFRLLEPVLEAFPLWVEYLSKQVGVGPAMAGAILTSFDIEEAKYASSFWKIAGLDVVNGEGRSRRAEHLILHHYKDKKGKPAERMGITFDAWLKTKMVGVLATSFLRANSPWRKPYDDYKHRLETDPNRKKITVNEWKKKNDRGEEDMRQYWPPGRINNASKRYMIKMFLADLWEHWRVLEGLPVGPRYDEAKFGHKHGRAA